MKNKDVCSEENCDKIAKIGLGGNGFNNLYCGKHFEIIMKHQETREQNFYDKGYTQAKKDFEEILKDRQDTIETQFNVFLKTEVQPQGKLLVKCMKLCALVQEQNKEELTKLKEGDKT